MSDSSQGLFSDPNLAIQVATLPQQAVAQQDEQKAEVDARKAKGGFLNSLMGDVATVGKGLDGALKHVGVGPVNAGNALKAAWYPVDKTASGAYWLYSNGVSQPLSAAFLMTARQDMGSASFFNADDWAKTYQQAQHISPGEAAENALGTVAAAGPKWQQSLLSHGPTKFTNAEKDRINQQTDRFLYDTDYWRSKVGWRYNVGSGALDFTTSMGLDPTVGVLRVGGAATKGSRSVKVLTAAEKAEQASKIGKLPTPTNLASRITLGLSKTPEEASRMDKTNKFFDWTQTPSAAGATRKSPFELAQNPIFGRGRRVNPAANQLSEVFANADRIEQPLIMKFATGDADAAAQLATKNKDLMAQLGRMSDNRVLVDAAKFEPALFEHFTQETQAGRAAADATRPGIGGISPSTTPAGQLVEPPYPRPTTPGPRQQGWDATYGKLAETAKVYRKATGDILSSGNGVRPMGGAAGTTLADSLRFGDWRAAQLKAIDAQVKTTSEKTGFYQDILGSDVRAAEDFSPGKSNLFGSMNNLYRQGALGIRNPNMSAEAKIAAQVRDRKNAAAGGAGKFVARTIRQGYYQAPLRVIQSFGDQLPAGMVNHNESDATDRVMNMLKQVPGLGADTRLGMLNQYSSAPDKFAKSAVLKKITSQVVDHMAQNLHDLDPQTAQAIDKMIATGTTDAMSQLTGKGIPNQQMFSAAESSITGRRVDKLEDNEGLIVAPQAKTQLSYSEPLLDVRELHRALYRSSGHLQSLKAAGGAVRDNLSSVADTFSNIWKASTLLRLGYILRAPSEEMAGSAVKYGMIRSIMDTAHGGTNWALNREHYVKALVGKGSYTSTTGGAARVEILDPTVAAQAAARGDKVTRINVGKAWPVVMDRIDRENTALKGVQKRIDALESDPVHDPNELANLHTQAAEHNDIIAEHRDYADEILRQATDATGRRLGESTIVHRGVTVPEAFSKEWENPIPRDQITSDHNMEVAFARGEGIDTSRMIRTGSWTAVTPDQPNHMESWLNALNKQFRQDDLFRHVAGDPTLKTASDWLRTPAGRFHVSQLGPQAKDQQRLLQGIRDTLDHYLPAPSLQGKLARNEEIKESELRSTMAKEDFPPVHGEEVKGLTAKGSADTAAGVVDRIIEKGFTRMGMIPTDVMSRQPTYLRAQEARMRQLIDQELDFQKAAGQSGDSIHPDKLNDMLQKSDKMARKDISQTVYDPTRTTATQALRFVAPFLAAHIDGLERWAGLVAEKPAFVGRAARIYNAPVAANLVTDQQGNYVDENGYAVTRDDNGKIIGKHFVGIQDRTLHLRIPDGTKNLRGVQSGIPIKIQALNTILPGDPWWNPGTGPMVQVAASQLAKKDPALGDFLQWSKVLPYGPQSGGIASDIQSAFTPKYVADMWTAYHPNSEKFQQTMLQEYQRQVADHLNGGPPPDINKAEKNAKSFTFLKALTSWASPAQTQQTPLTGTPYQFYIDQYKKMQQVDPKNADDQFLQKFGEDYFIFTTSLSKSMGIAPTVSALATAKQYKDLIAGDSSLASFIVGDVYNKGKFSSSAYAAEKDMTIGGEKVRSTQSVQDALQQNKANLGWAQYTQAMNGMDAALIRAGFRSYQQAGAENFLQAKQNITNALKQQNEAWEQDFDTTDRGLVPRRIKSFEILVQDPKLAGDPMRQDIPALRGYLQGRQIFKAQLAARGASQLSLGVDGSPSPTSDTADIAQQWMQFQTQMIASNTKFADVFHRYLSNDTLQ